MKLTAVFLLAGCLQVAAKTSGQTVTLKVKDAPLKQVLVAIQEQTGFSVLFDNQLIDLAKPVTVDVKDQPLDKVMTLCLKDQPFDFSLAGAAITIKRKIVSGEGHERIAANPIRGVVRGPDGKPLAGVNIVIKGTKKGTTTDENGVFSLNVSEGEVLILTSIGYSAKEVTFNGQVVNVTLEISSSPLDEVQIIAYGQTTKRFNTGNVTTVSSDEIEKTVVSNPLQALQGKVPGMIISQQTGVPGSSFKVQIRGRNSVNPDVGNDPLYIVDGIQYPSASFQALGADILGRGSNNLGGNPLNFLNSYDIQSIEILKDADATAIYGSRGANGVVIITTKRASEGNSAVDLSVISGVGWVKKWNNLMNTQQYLSMRREAFLNDGLPVPTLDDPPGNVEFDVNGTWDTTRYTDWQKVLSGNTAKYTNANASFRGGNSSFQYLLGGTYNRQTTVFPGDLSDTKVSFHMNLNTVSKNRKFKASFSQNYLFDNNKLIAQDLLASNGLTLAPNAPSIYDSSGKFNTDNYRWTNPMANLLIKYQSKTKNLIANAALSFEILPGLEIRSNIGYNEIMNEENIGRPIEYNILVAQGGNTGSADFRTDNIKTWNVEPQLTYSFKFHKNAFNILVGSTFQSSFNEDQKIQATGYTNDALLGNINAASTKTGLANSVEYRYNAIFGRVSYSYNNKYLINLTGRRDGSSRFGPENMFANFGAVGAGWIFSEEAFLKNNLKSLSFGKLRFSYGSAGNDQIGDYQYLDLFETGTSNLYQGASGLRPRNLFNPNYGWEVIKKLEAGIDFGFFNDRILLNLSYYRNRSSNQLVSFPLSSVTGFTGISANNKDAVIQNSGFELSLNTLNIKTRDLEWKTNFNIWNTKNKLVSYDDFENSPYSFDWEVGQPLTIQKAYKYREIDPETGLYTFYNSKGETTSSPSLQTDRTVLINLAPKFVGGLGNTLRFKRFELYLFFEFRKQQGANAFLPAIAPGFGVITTNMPVELLDRWISPTQIGKYQKFSQTFEALTAQGFAKGSDFGFGDASFVRLKTMSLSYKLPSSILTRASLVDCNFFIQGQNLLTFTKYKGADPETQSVQSIPPLTILTAGIKLTL